MSRFDPDFIQQLTKKWNLFLMQALGLTLERCQPLRKIYEDWQRID
jgi:hypothetical protein